MEEIKARAFEARDSYRAGFITRNETKVYKFCGVHKMIQQEIEKQKAYIQTLADGKHKKDAIQHLKRLYRKERLEKRQRAST